jgi:hypothetical protein
MNGFELHGFSFALGWNGEDGRGLAAFNVNFLKENLEKCK